MENPNRYRPVACDFYDRLEAFATLRRRVRLSLSDEGKGAPSFAEGRIADIFTRQDKQEFLRLDTGAEVRLDRILAISPLGGDPGTSPVSPQRDNQGEGHPGLSCP